MLNIFIMLKCKFHNFFFLIIDNRFNLYHFENVLFYQNKTK